MTRPRKALVSLLETPYYHITSRCVRQAFLCGENKFTGQSYEHRRQWVVDRIRLLSSLFAIDVCAYAVMNNHYHIVLKICPEQIEALSDQQVMERWCCLFKGPLLIQQYRDEVALSPAELATVNDIIGVWRKRLSDLSWFMRCLNQHIAQKANREDGCTGKFWEARFTSQALKTEEAIISCMSYVDLNPIRAGIADTPETSEYTSVKERITPAFELTRAIRKQIDAKELVDFNHTLKPLLHFDNSHRDFSKNGIPFDYKDYLSLVDSTGRAIRSNKRGVIPSRLSPILERLSISHDRWIQSNQHFEHLHRRRAYDKTRSSSGT